MVDVYELEKKSVDFAKIEQIAEVLGDCALLNGADIKNDIEQNFPLTMWLTRTNLARRIKANAGLGLLNKYKASEGRFAGKWMIKLPGKVWTTPADDSQFDACCWVGDDIAKCSGEMPLEMVCLKDCENIYDTLATRALTFGVQVDGLVTKDETIKQLKDFINIRSLAMHSAYTMVQGTWGSGSGLVKSFHGLAEVLSNPAILKLDASEIGVLAAFDTLGCRIAAMGGDISGKVFWAHPMTYENIKRLIKKDIYGNYPDNWTVDGDTVRFYGIPFRVTKEVPFHFADALGTVYLLDSDAVAGVWSTDIAVTNPDFIRRTYSYGGADNQCGIDCEYRYNIGGVGANDANRLAVITNIPTSNICMNAIGDLEKLLVPDTIIPGV